MVICGGGTAGLGGSTDPLVLEVEPRGQVVGQ